MKPAISSYYLSSCLFEFLLESDVCLFTNNNIAMFVIFYTFFESIETRHFLLFLLQYTKGKGLSHGFFEFLQESNVSFFNNNKIAMFVRFYSFSESMETRRFLLFCLQHSKGKGISDFFFEFLLEFDVSVVNNNKIAKSVVGRTPNA